jgi:hypothetical protein
MRCNITNAHLFEWFFLWQLHGNHMRQSVPVAKSLWLGYQWAKV